MQRQSNPAAETQPRLLLADPAERRKRELKNGLRQYDLTSRLIREMGAGFVLTPDVVCALNRTAMDGVRSDAGEFRGGPMYIDGSIHEPPSAAEVPELVTEMCDYANADGHSALHAAAYLMWRLNWIHPFNDGNGRTSRVVSYLALCVKIGNGPLPGTNTVPAQIAADKPIYYAALDAADAVLKAEDRIDVSEMETLLEKLLAKQFLSAIEAAKT